MAAIPSRNSPLEDKPCAATVDAVDNAKIVAKILNFNTVFLPEVCGIAKNTTFEELVGGRADTGHSLQYKLQTDRRFTGSVTRRNMPA